MTHATTDTHHETQVHADPDVPLIRIVREFDAPPEQVFRAHTDPNLLARRLGPRGMETGVREGYERLDELLVG